MALPASVTTSSSVSDKTPVLPVDTVVTDPPTPELVLSAVTTWTPLYSKTAELEDPALTTMVIVSAVVRALVKVVLNIPTFRALAVETSLVQVLPLLSETDVIVALAPTVTARIKKLPAVVLLAIDRVLVLLATPARCTKAAIVLVYQCYEIIPARDLINSSFPPIDTCRLISEIFRTPFTLCEIPVAPNIYVWR